MLKRYLQHNTRHSLVLSHRLVPARCVHPRATSLHLFRVSETEHQRSF